MEAGRLRPIDKDWTVEAGRSRPIDGDLPVRPDG